MNILCKFFFLLFLLFVFWFYFSRYFHMFGSKVMLIHHTWQNTMILYSIHSTLSCIHYTQVRPRARVRIISPFPTCILRRRGMRRKKATAVNYNSTGTGLCIMYIVCVSDPCTLQISLFTSSHSYSLHFCFCISSSQVRFSSFISFSFTHFGISAVYFMHVPILFYFQEYTAFLKVNMHKKIRAIITKIIVGCFSFISLCVYVWKSSADVSIFLLHGHQHLLLLLLLFYCIFHLVSFKFYNAIL